MPFNNQQHQNVQPGTYDQAKTYRTRLSGTEQTMEAAFTPKRSLVRSQYRPPAQTPSIGHDQSTDGCESEANGFTRVPHRRPCLRRALGGCGLRHHCGGCRDPE